MEQLTINTLGHTSNRLVNKAYNSRGKCLQRGPEWGISFHKSSFFNSCLQACVALNQYIELLLHRNIHLAQQPGLCSSNRDDLHLYSASHFPETLVYIIFPDIIHSIILGQLFYCLRWNKKGGEEGRTYVIIIRHIILGRCCHRQDESWEEHGFHGAMPPKGRAGAVRSPVLSFLVPLFFSTCPSLFLLICTHQVFREFSLLFAASVQW